MFCYRVSLCIVLLLSLFSNNIIFSTGFAAGTLIRAESGYVPIEQIKEGDQVIGFDSNQAPDCCKVASVAKRQSEKLVKITIEDEFFIVAPDQLFLAPQNTWVQAVNLEPGNVIMGLHESCAIKNVEVVEECAELYTLSIENKRMFFISRHDVAVFNFPNRIVRRTGGCIVKPATDDSIKQTTQAIAIQVVIQLIGKIIA